MRPAKEYVWVTVATAAVILFSQTALYIAGYSGEKYVLELFGFYRVIGVVGTTFIIIRTVLRFTEMNSKEVLVAFLCSIILVASYGIPQWESPESIFLRGFSRRVRETIDANILEVWAEKTLQGVESNNPPIQITQHYFPDALRTLQYSSRPEVWAYYYNAVGGMIGVMTVSYGGRPRGWGIHIYATPHSPEPWGNRRILRWTDKMYFWCSYGS